MDLKTNRLGIDWTKVSHRPRLRNQLQADYIVVFYLQQIILIDNMNDNRRQYETFICHKHKIKHNNLILNLSADGLKVGAKSFMDP